MKSYSCASRKALSNNDAEALKGTGQEKFPDTEIQAITYYLFKASEDYLTSAVASRKLEAKDRERQTTLQGKIAPTAEEKKELDDIKARDRLRNVKLLTDLAPGYVGDKDKGRVLFSERGCLACHSHKALEEPQGKLGQASFAPAVMGEAIKILVSLEEDLKSELAEAVLAVEPEVQIIGMSEDLEGRWNTATEQAADLLMVACGGYSQRALTFIDRTVKAISFAPRKAASRGGIPCSRYRLTFSSTTMASSTTNPVAIVSAMRE